MNDEEKRENKGEGKRVESEGKMMGTTIITETNERKEREGRRKE